MDRMKELKGRKSLTKKDQRRDQMTLKDKSDLKIGIKKGQVTFKRSKEIEDQGHIENEDQ